MLTFAVDLPCPFFLLLLSRAAVSNLSGFADWREGVGTHSFICTSRRRMHLPLTQMELYVHSHSMCKSSCVHSCSSLLQPGSEQVTAPGVDSREPSKFNRRLHRVLKEESLLISFPKPVTIGFNPKCLL